MALDDPEFLRFSANRLISSYVKHELSPVEVVEACIRRIERLNPRFHIYIGVLAEDALSGARKAERAYIRGMARGILEGLPVSVKDVFAAEGGPTTWGLKELAQYAPGHDSTVVTRLRQEGAILLGKTNVDTYPYQGPPGSPRLIGPTPNPWDPKRTAGRSSGGSAASVAACFDYGSIGSDLGGSIRIPAAFCGVVGLLPTFGLVSNFGAFPYSKSFDHCGPIARSVEDCALLLRALAGHDPKDPLTVKRAVPDYTQIAGPIQGLRVGVPRPTAWPMNQPDVTRLVDGAIESLVNLGVEVREIEMPYYREARWVVTVGILETTNLTEGMHQRQVPPDPFAAVMLARALAGRERLIEQGMQIRRAARSRYADIFRDIDVIATPTVATTAPLLTEDNSTWQLPDEPYAELIARHTILFNLIHHPAISVPCGFGNDRMPVGLQLATRPFEEETLFRVAYAYERETGWHAMFPTMS